MDVKKAKKPVSEKIEQNCCIVCRPCPTTPKYVLCKSKTGKKHCIRLLPKGCISEAIVPEVILKENETDGEQEDEQAIKAKLIAKARGQYKSRYDNFYNNYNIDYRNKKCRNME